MKRLLVTLMLLGAIGCGSSAAPRSAPAPQSTATEAAAVEPVTADAGPSPDQYLSEDPMSALEKLGAEFDENDQGQITSVYFEVAKIGDAGLAHLRGLANLEDLDLSGTQITDAGLVAIEELVGLKELRLPDGISDAGLAHLRPLAELRELHLVGAQISDAGLLHVKHLTGLQGLYLETPQVTDGGLRHLEGLVELDRLRLPRRITDAGLAQVAAHGHLKRVDLSNTQISDAGLVHVAGLSELQSLNLGMTGITDSGLLHLKGLQDLRYLGLFQCVRVTNAGVAAIQRDLPECKITQ